MAAATYRWTPVRPVAAAPAATGLHRAPSLFVRSVPYLVVLGLVVLLEAIYSEAPVPPGIDPGHWIASSYGWVGLSSPPVASAGSPFAAPPVSLVLLGLLVRATGSPLQAGFVFAGLALGAFGGTAILLGRRTLDHPGLQLAFVGLAVGNPVTLAMLFWGGYPNFLGLVVLNGLVVVFAGLVQRPSSARLTVGLYALLGVLLLTDTLTLALAVLVYAAGALVLLLRGRWSIRAVVNRRHLAGFALLGGTAVTYFGLLRATGVTPPGYATANPSAFFVSNVGQVFGAFWSGCGCVHPAVPVPVALAVLGLLALGGFGAALVAARRRVVEAPPAASDRRSAAGVVAGCWLAAAAGLPLLGYLAHVDTDYSRFGYFLVVPGILLGAVLAERHLMPHAAPAVVESTRRSLAQHPRPSGVVRPVGVIVRRRALWASVPTTAASLAVLFALAVFAVAVTVPAVENLETANTGATHDGQFLQAMHWLATQAQSGAVLTGPSKARWVQALTDRGSYDGGPTWLLFYGWQIQNAEESYWAINGRYTVSDGASFVTFTGADTSGLAGDPAYGAYQYGIPAPILRLSPALSYVNVSGGAGVATHSFSSIGAEQVVLGNGTPTALTTRTGSSAVLTETVTEPSAGVAVIDLVARAVGGGVIQQVGITLLPTSNFDPFVHGGLLSSVTVNGSTATWTERTQIGQIPGARTLTTTIGLSPTPVRTRALGASGPDGFALVFAPSAPASAFSVHLTLTTPKAGGVGVALPPTFDTLAFLTDNQVHFLLAPTSAMFADTLAYYGQEFHFAPAYSNSEWEVLAG
ncbi:MAG TPA: hypothetical protein VFF67_09465 [Thermoplasmata archaeon]|nr:hypothetical protein [Thermoplasmata archaeon]